jgi:nucleoside 2-deoxyribosyltransferase
MRTVYLAGLISTEAKESIEWRKRVAGVLAATFSIRTPMAGKPHLEVESDDGGLNDKRCTAKDIVARDRRDVREADVILVHLSDFGSDRPLIGTLCELAWAWEQRTPVVAIADKDDYVMRNHPFISEFVSHYVETEKEAIDHLNLYYV